MKRILLKNKFWILLLLISLAVTGYSALKYYNVVSLKKWEQTTAEIISSKKIYVEDAKRGGYRSATIETIEKYYPVINYSYIVDDKVYNSDKYEIYKDDYTYYNADDVERILLYNIRGDKVKVYYNAKKPEESVLKLTGESNYYDDFIFKLAFSIVLFIIVLLQIRHSYNKEV